MWIWGLVALLLAMIVVTVFGGLGGVAVGLVLPGLVLTIGVLVYYLTRGTRGTRA